MRERIGRNAAAHERLMIDMAQAKRIREAAFMQTLISTGVEYEPGIAEAVWSDVAALAEEYGASRDDVQRALETHEPSLSVNPWNE